MVRRLIKGWSGSRYVLWFAFENWDRGAHMMTGDLESPCTVAAEASWAWPWEPNEHNKFHSSTFIRTVIFTINTVNPREARTQGLANSLSGKPCTKFGRSWSRLNFLDSSTFSSLQYPPILTINQPITPNCSETYCTDRLFIYLHRSWRGFGMVKTRWQARRPQWQRLQLLRLLYLQR